MAEVISMAACFPSYRNMFENTVPRLRADHGSGIRCALPAQEGRSGASAIQQALRDARDGEQQDREPAQAAQRAPFARAAKRAIPPEACEDIVVALCEQGGASGAGAASGSMFRPGSERFLQRLVRADPDAEHVQALIIGSPVVVR